MTFNAGSIESTLDLDRTPFQRGLRQARQEAEAFSKRKLKLPAELDTAKLDTELTALDRRLATGHKLDINTAGAEAKLAAVATQVGAVNRQIKSTGKEAERAIHPLIDALVIAGPATLPLLSGLAGISTALVGLGVDGVLAMQGVKKEMKDNTALGRQYSQGLRVIQSDLTSLEKLSTRSVLPPSLLSNLHAELPALEAFVTRTAPGVSDILQHGIGVFLGTLSAATPTIITAEDALAGMLKHLETWATGPAGQQFFQHLADDIPVAMHTLGDFFTTLFRVVSAFRPVGQDILGVLDSISKFINTLPGGKAILEAGAYALVFWRISALAAAAETKLFGESAAASVEPVVAETLAVKALGTAAATAAAELDVLAVSQGAAIGGAMAANLKKSGLLSLFGSAGLTAKGLGGAALKLGVGVLGADLALGYASNITQPSPTDTNTGVFSKRTLNAGFDFAKGIFSGNFGSFGQDLSQKRAVEATKRDQRAVDDYLANVRRLKDKLASEGGVTSLSIFNKFLARDDIGAAYSRENAATVNAGLSRREQAPVTAAGTQALRDYGAQLQKNVDIESNWLDLSSKNIVVIDGVRVSNTKYNEVLRDTNGDIGKAISVIKAHGQALQDDLAAQKDANDGADLAAKFLGDLQDKYHLTAQQVDTLASVLGTTDIDLRNHAGNLGAVERGYVALQKAIDNGPPSVRTYIAAMAQLDQADNSVTNRANLLGIALRSLSGDTLDSASVNLDAAGSLEALATALHDNSKSVGANGELLGQLVKVGDRWEVQQPRLTAGSIAIASAMSATRDKAVALASSIFQNTGHAGKAADAFNGMRAQVVQTAIDMGYTSKKAEALANDIFGIPQDAKTIAELIEKNDMTGAIRKLTRSIKYLARIFQTALGINISGKSDLDKVYDQIFNLTSSPHGVNVGVSTSSNGVLPALIPRAAGGVLPEGWSSVGERGWEAAYTENGKTMIFSNEQSKKIMPQGIVRGFDSGTLPSLYIPSPVAAGATAGQKTAFADTLQSYIDSGNALFTAALASLKSQLQSFYDTVRRMGQDHLISPTRVAEFKAETHDIALDVARRDALINRINADKQKLQDIKDKRRQEQESVTNTVLGTFDAGTSGNGYTRGIMSSLDQSIANADKFISLRDQAKKLGLDPKIIQQITEEGPAVAARNLQAIVAGGATYVSQLNAKEAQLRTLAGQLGTSQATDLYGAAQKKAEAQLAADRKKRDKFQAEINKDLRALLAELRSFRNALISATRQG